MAQHSVALANAEWKPSLSLTGNLQYQDDGVDSLLRTDNQSYTMGRRACSVPLFAAPGVGRETRRRHRAGQAVGARPRMRRPMPPVSKSNRPGRRSRRQTKS